MIPIQAAKTKTRRGWGTQLSCASWFAAEPWLAVQPVRMPGQWAQAGQAAWALHRELAEPWALPELPRWALHREQEQPPV